MSQRKFLPSLSDLLDRLSVLELKYVRIPENKETYAKEIDDVMHDIQLLFDEKGINVSASCFRDTIILAHSNNHIWYNESKAREGQKDGNSLILTHSINGIRNSAKNRLTNSFGGRVDLKIDCLAADAEHWKPHGY